MCGQVMATCTVRYLRQLVFGLTMTIHQSTNQTVMNTCSTCLGRICKQPDSHHRPTRDCLVADIWLGWGKFNMFAIISLLFLHWRGAKVYSQTGWRAMAGFFSPGSATAWWLC